MLALQNGSSIYETSILTPPLQSPPVGRRDVTLLPVTAEDLQGISRARPSWASYHSENHARELSSSLRRHCATMSIPGLAWPLHRLAIWRERQVVYLIDEGSSASRSAEIRGGKGASLSELVAQGMPVPPGATIVTEVSQRYMEKQQLPSFLAIQLGAALRRIEKKTGLRLGSQKAPLLVSVRSGARVSMPGMMDTVLNVGLNNKTVHGLARRAGERFAWDSYRRFLSMFGTTVMGVEKEDFESRLNRFKDRLGLQNDCDLPVEEVQQLCRIYESVIETACGRPVPTDPIEQLTMAIFAVLGSWNSERCQAYREAENIPSSWGTAVNIQAMVFGNTGDNSGTGVVFSRNPLTGEKGLFGEFLVNAQGEDVVAGTRTPQSIASLETAMPAVYAELDTMVAKLEHHFQEIMDVEFTVEDGRLFLLQCRAAKRTAQASAAFAVDQMLDGKWSRKVALKRVKPRDRDQLKYPSFDPQALTIATEDRLWARGNGASPGAVTGKAVFSCSRARELGQQGIPVVLMRPDTSPNDLPGMLASKAIVTAIGGSTSHAAVVARGKNIPAVVGCNFAIKSDDNGNYAVAGNQIIREEEDVSVDGTTGAIIYGSLAMVESIHSDKVQVFMGWLAEEEAAKAAKGIDVSLLKTYHNLNTWLNDFYLSNLMAASSRNTALEEKAIELADTIEAKLAQILTAYLAFAVLTEINCFARQGRNKEADEAHKLLVSKYFLERLQYDAFVASVANRPIDEQAEYFDLCRLIFLDKTWSSSFGGPRWAAIAEAPMLYLKGETPRTVFVDHVWDLRHNGGVLFNKHDMARHITNEYGLHQQLEIKKKANGAYELIKGLSNHGFSPEVLALFEEGDSLSLWGSAAESAAYARDKAEREEAERNRRTATDLGGSSAISSPVWASPEAPITDDSSITKTVPFWAKGDSEIWQHESVHFLPPAAEFKKILNIFQEPQINTEVYKDLIKGLSDLHIDDWKVGANQIWQHESSHFDPFKHGFKTGTSRVSKSAMAKLLAAQWQESLQGAAEHNELKQLPANCDPVQYYDLLSGKVGTVGFNPNTGRYLLPKPIGHSAKSLSMAKHSFLAQVH